MVFLDLRDSKKKKEIFRCEEKKISGSNYKKKIREESEDKNIPVHLTLLSLCQYDRKDKGSRHRRSPRRDRFFDDGFTNQQSG